MFSNAAKTRAEKAVKYTHCMQVTSMTGYKFVIQGSYIDQENGTIQMLSTGEYLTVGWI